MLADGQPVKIDTKPSVIVMIGVNGAGKTTTIGKMALRYKNEGKRSFSAPPTPSAPPP